MGLSCISGIGFSLHRGQWRFSFQKIVVIKHISWGFVMVFCRIVNDSCSIHRDTGEQLFSILFHGGVDIDAISASWNWVVGMWLKARVLQKKFGEKRLQTIVNPLMHIWKMEFSCSEQQTSISLHGLNGAAPVVLKNNLSEHHVFDRVFWVHNANGNAEMFIHDACHWNCGKVVEMLIIILDKIVVRSGSNDGHDSTEQELDVCNI